MTYLHKNNFSVSGHVSVPCMFILFLYLLCSAKGDTTCPTLPDILNSEWDSSAHTPPFLEGYEISYNCASGYVTSSGAHPKATCKIVNGIAEWDVVVCMPVSCGPPPYVKNAMRNGDLFTFPNKVTYVCDDGYKIKGYDTLFCMTTSQWYREIPPTCEEVFCSSLTDPINGRVITGNKKYEDKATYECDRHFHLEGNKHRYCDKDGAWTGSDPSCIKATCPKPIFSGRMQPDKDVYDAGNIIAFTCNEGGRFPTSKCRKDGTWSATPPSCEDQSKTEESTSSTTVTITASDSATVISGDMDTVTTSTSAPTIGTGSASKPALHISHIVFLIAVCLGSLCCY